MLVAPAPECSVEPLAVGNLVEALEQYGQAVIVAESVARGELAQPGVSGSETAALKRFGIG